MFQRILIAWDASRPARHALDIAIDIARRYDGEVIAVSVAQAPLHAETREDREESTQAAREHLKSTLAELSDRADRAGVPLEHSIITGNHPAQDILAFAHEHAVDLIVVGRHAKGRAGRLLLHGISEQFAQSATLPVLIVGEPNGHG
jgi:nucleotide-binding universal stress UspA family protein